MTLAKPILTYFDTQGRAEVIRLAFKAGGIDFEDKRITPAEFKTEYKAKSPSGLLPMLELDSGKYVEMNAILKYVCALSGNVPSTPTEWLASDMIVDRLNDLTHYPMKIHRAPDEAAKAAAIAEALEAISRIMPVVDQMVKDNQPEPGHLVKGKPFCPADLIIFCWMRALEKKMMGVDIGDVKTKYPHMWEVKEAVLRDNKAIQEHVGMSK
eukprot:Gregarina_sp_Poly_1__7852@NODE_445_length_8333_cov_573_313090_g363_i0_p3_GENE_NODE_445_length_8333_cov_573_313090_g363_i0NODE_445_length_8333_cov_573_313090_g363_i0_p3_ORF_typecomplete_len211_score36_01GST_N/PF02798_20/6e13GST_N_3/PF13417_6/2_8e07GST_C_3/PF14497_6/4_9e05GST_C/PF00043_25/0_0061NAD_synthase/PF02540_17/0_041GST_N_4/PF17172_4/0_13Tom37/PF10568_9/0_085_NODE_445_length_8333_cov_573_313090_g363_i03911023